MPTENEIRKASEQFYSAINRMLNGDAAPMAEIWSHSASVTTMHPIGGLQIGWDKVRQSWEQVSGLASEGKASLADQSIQVAGDMAYELGVEHAQGKFGGEQVAMEQRVTNIYRREAGGWKIVHHHTDISPAFVDLLSRLQPAR